MKQSELIHWGHYRALLRSTFLIETRGRTAVKPYRRTISLLISYVISSLYLAWNLSRDFYEPVYVLISFTVSMYLAGFTVITSYSFHVLDSTDELLLQQFPVSEKTLFAVRSTNLFLYIFLISIPFYIPLAVFFVLHSAEPATVTYLLVVLFFSSLWTSCLFLIFYNVITQLFSQSAKIFGAIQVLFILLLLFFYQSLPRFDAAAVDWNNILTGVLPYVFPPIWFSSFFWSLQGYSVIPAQTTVMIFGAVTLVLFLTMLRSRLLLLPRMPRTLDDAPSSRRSLGFLILSFTSVFGPRSGSRRAGYDFLRSTLFRDRLLQIHLLPVILMPVAVVLYGILTHQCASPFERRIFESTSLMHFTTVVFFLFAVRHVITTITHTRFAPARWLFSMVNTPSLEYYTKGVYSGVVWNIFLPLAGLIFLLFTFAMSVTDSLLQAGFLLLASRFQLSSWSIFRKQIPFSEYEDKFSSAKRLTQFFFIIPYIFFFIILHYLSSVTLGAFFLFLVGLEAGSQFCFKFLGRKQQQLRVE